MILSRTYMILSRICLLLALVGGICVIVYAFEGQWSNAGMSLYYSFVILVMGVIAHDYNMSRMRKALH